MGIDPGSIFCGYGIIERSGKDGTEYIVSGRIALNRGDPLNKRLAELFTNLSEIIIEYQPEEAAIEKIFFAKGIKAALNLGHARGIALVAATIENLAVFEYSALEVKKSVVGYGRADKRQVMEMVSGILDIRQILSEDSADALALALCHLNTLDLATLARKA
ncbi:MAG TPA: crossover junction endodeoxyribonuclease RuvC [Nitrospirae bacterium]|nr:crossover junction endodeoxyribonuclease RuvC [Nitrospirota bacterium]HDO22586.1 crossover junction endodeoxyribonuclease RuvC [Nitrospirota bacterium]HDZ87090.1 crossover junction endodeoxyribonuclease RuvC [Nitrospirota bacterium]